MKIKKSHVLLLGLITILPLSFLFITVPLSHAQSGTTWTDPINLSNAGSSTNPVLIVDSAGTFHAFWVDGFEGYQYTESADGVTWTPPKSVRFPFSPKDPTKPVDTKLVLFAGANEQAYAFWQDSKASLYFSTVAKNFDAPSSWSAPRNLSDSVMAYSAAVDSQGILHVSYVTSLQTNPRPAGVYYLRLNGTVSSDPINLYSSRYFRSLGPENANVQIAVSELKDIETVFVVWDDPYQKRILMSKSADGGKLWDEPAQIRSADENASTPFNINIGAFENKVLLLWQSGIPGGQCAQFSQSSVDGGKQFSPPLRMLEEQAGCPQAGDFVMMSQDIALVSFNILGDISITAWNGSAWSKPQTQNEIITFVNPETFESVILGCPQTSSYQGHLFIVGCDQGSSGDVWFSSRSLGNVKSWFPDPSIWTMPNEVTEVDQPISQLISIADDANNVHLFWGHSALGEEGGDAIQYAQWNGKSWSHPRAVISGLDGRPVQLSAEADHQQRLLLAWVNSKTGEILFSWAGADPRAGIASDWQTPQFIPSISEVNSFPDILVDGSGKIVVAYAVPINEERGIYFVESDDGGATWTNPFRIFDAAAAGWDVIDQPKIALTGDGRLHLLFGRYSFQGELRYSQGLYYSQSADGGMTWSDVETVSENLVPWSEIVSDGNATVHRLWQEQSQSLVTFHQISQDNGLAWSDPMIVSDISSLESLASQSMDKAGKLYYLQLTGVDNLTVLSHLWNGSGWILQESKELYVKDQGVLSFITAAVSSKGTLLVSVLTSYLPPKDDLKGRILSMSKSFEVPDQLQDPSPAIIPFAEPSEVAEEESAIAVPSSTEISAVTNLNDLPSSLPDRNVVGLVFLGVIVVVVILMFRPVSRKQDKQNKTLHQ